jgi:hypothetical protein
MICHERRERGERGEGRGEGEDGEREGVSLVCAYVITRLRLASPLRCRGY